MPNVLPRCFWTPVNRAVWVHLFSFSLQYCSHADRWLYTKHTVKSIFTTEPVQIKCTAWQFYKLNTLSQPVSTQTPKWPQQQRNGERFSMPSSLYKGTSPRAQQLWGWKLIIAAFSQNWGGSVPSFTDWEWGTVSFIPWETEEGGKVVCVLKLDEL